MITKTEECMKEAAQYWNLFPEITTPHHHQGPLIDPNTREPYVMVMVGDFWLEDTFFPGSPRDSLLINEDDLARLKRRVLHISIYREEKPQHPTTINTSLPASRKTFLQQRGGIMQDQWQDLRGFFAPSP